MHDILQVWPHVPLCVLLRWRKEARKYYDPVKLAAQRARKSLEV